MTSRDFCYWLQGFFELDDNGTTKAKVISEKQMTIIRNHLAMVFKHEIDPSFGDKEMQDALSHIHDSDIIVRC